MRNLVRAWTWWWVVLAVGAVGSATTAAWAAVSVRRRPRGHDVVVRMSHHEAAPDLAPGAQALTPVVLVHGLGMSGRSMRRLVSALGQTTRTLAPDLPGYGRSPQPALGALGVHDLARTLLAWMDDQRIDRAVLVGHSVGSQVAGEVALLAPERVSRLVVIGPTGDPARPSLRRQTLRLLRGVLHEPPLLLAVAAVDYVHAGPGQMVMLMRRAVQRAAEQQDVTVDVPLLVVRGSQDRVCRQEWCETVVSRTPGSRLVVVQDSAHGIAFEAPPELVDLLREEVHAASRGTQTRPDDLADASPR